MKRYLPELGLIIACLFWGASFFVMKDALKQINPVSLCAIRMTMGAVIIGVAALFMKKPLLGGLKEGIILGLLLSCVLLAQTIGLEITTAANSGFITGMFVVFVPLLSFLFYRKKLNTLKVFAVVVNLIGLWLLTGGIKGMNIGDILTIFAAIFGGAHIVYISEVMNRKGVDAYVLCFHQFAVAALVTGAISLFFGYSFALGETANIYRLLFVGIFATAISFLLQLVSQKGMVPVKAALLLTMEPVFAATFAWTLGGEKLVSMAAVGGGVMVAGMIISEVKISKKEKRNTR